MSIFKQEFYKILRNRLWVILGILLMLILSAVTSFPKQYSINQFVTDITRVFTSDSQTNPRVFKYDQLIPIADKNDVLYYLGEINQRYFLIKLTQADKENNPSLLKSFNESEILHDKKTLKFFTKGLEKANNLRAPTKVSGFITKYPDRYLTDQELQIYQSITRDAKFQNITINTDFLILSPSLYPKIPDEMITFLIYMALGTILMVWLIIQTVFYRTFIQLRINKMNISGSVSEIEENFNLHPLNLTELSRGYMNQDWMILRSFANLQILKLSDLLMFSPKQKQFYSKALEAPLKIRSLTRDDIQKITSHLSRFYPEIYVGDDESILIAYQHGRYALTKLVETRKNSEILDESLAFSDQIADQQSIEAKNKKDRDDNLVMYIGIFYVLLCVVVAFINPWIALLMFLPWIIYDFIKGGLLLLRSPYDAVKHGVKTYKDYKKK